MKYKGKKRSPKPKRRNELRPPVLENGDILVELLTRSKHALTQTYNKWSGRQKTRRGSVQDIRICREIRI